jgi:hypothetical protein
MSLQTRQGITALFIAAAAAGACSPEQPATPPAQAQSQTVQKPNVPTLVTGCLRAGEATNTFVLTTTQSGDGSTSATYQLNGSAGVNLADHVGKRIEVNGVLREQAQIATTESKQPVEDKAKGTTGTPSVQTATELSIRQLDVTAVKQAAGECEK